VAISLFCVKFVVVFVLSVITVGGAVQVSGAPVEQQVPSVIESRNAALLKAIDRHQCSTTGFGADRVPSSALIRTPRGRMSLVTFDQGWAIYTGDRPGRLLAVCLAQPRV